ncbi:MAG: hypothetical protein KC519_18185, partial [Anaerolineae bacterium]|nr:hypothetical protein [Anaerolineae bacterium]
MDSRLLATKVRIPEPPHRAVYRSQLVNDLERGIPQHKLTLISAPAGYGKTTLLAQWVQMTNLAIGWLTLGEGDNEPERLFRYLLAAWEMLLPGIRGSEFGLRLDGLSPDSDALITAFINAANDIPDHLVFILDDYHLIHDAAIDEVLTFLIDHLPPRLHFVLAVRTQPALPLARYRARRALLEFRAEDLQFSPDETAQFMNGTMGLHLAHDDIDILQGQLEGWIAGLQLRALTLRRKGNVPKLPVTGKHRFIADYLSEDVLSPLPDHLQGFMLRVS